MLAAHMKTPHSRLPQASRSFEPSHAKRTRRNLLHQIDRDPKSNIAVEPHGLAGWQGTLTALPPNAPTGKFQAIGGGNFRNFPRASQDQSYRQDSTPATP
jgi:hypothetical protein